MNYSVCVFTGLRGVRPTDIPFADCIDNLSLFTGNRCGITHGLLDVGWNLAGVGSAVSFENKNNLFQIVLKTPSRNY